MLSIIPLLLLWEGGGEGEIVVCSISQTYPGVDGLEGILSTAIS